MDGLRTPLSPARHPAGDPRLADPRPAGVKGWLLLLCLMLVAVGPVLSTGLLLDTWQVHAPGLAASALTVCALAAITLSTVAAVAYGMRAGLSLWRVQPGAVALAKRALLLGLAADALDAVLQVALAHQVLAPGQGLLQAELQLLPGLAFFTLGYAYLNHSRRVQATFPDSH